MIKVTDRAAQQLEHMLSTQGIPKDQGIKLVPDPAGNIAMTVAPAGEGDEVVPRGEGEAPLLIVAAPIVPAVDGATLDVQNATGNGTQGSQFTLRRPGEGSLP